MNLSSISSNSPRSSDIKRTHEEILKNGRNPQGWVHPNTTIPFHRLGRLMNRVKELEKLTGGKPKGWKKPVYGQLDYIISWRMGWISDEDERRDRVKYEERRQRSLETCYQPSNNTYGRFQEWTEDLEMGFKPVRNAPLQTGAYIPEMPSHILYDRDLTDGAKVCLAKILEETYRMNREKRWLATTVPYLMAALGRSRRTIQNYLRLLERCGYILCEVLLSETTRMCNGLKINLCDASFARQHKEKWPSKKKKPSRMGDEEIVSMQANSGVQKDSLNNP